MNRMFSLMAAILVMLLYVTQGPAAAESFFEGKTIRFIASSSPGGGNDTYVRLFARHMGKYIPGHPKMIVQNMPGRAVW